MTSILASTYTFNEEAQRLIDSFVFSFCFVKTPKPRFEWGQKAAVYAVLRKAEKSYMTVYFEWNEGVFEYKGDAALGLEVPNLDNRFTWEFVNDQEEAFGMVHNWYNGKEWGDNYSEHMKLVGAK